MCSGEYDNIWNKDYISVIKSKRRSIGIEVHMDGRVILRAPYTLSEKQLEEFVDKHKLWIEEKRRYLGSKARAGISTNAKKKDELTKDEIKCIKEAFEKSGFEVIYLRGMNLPETVAEVAAEAKADMIGISNLLGMGMVLFPRVDQRLKELGLRDDVILMAGGRVAEKEEEHAFYENKMKQEGTDFLGVDAFFGPGSDPKACVNWAEAELERRGL